MKSFRISATGLKHYSTCPMRYHFYTTLEPVFIKPKWLQDGIDAHALLAGEDVPLVSQEAKAHYRRLSNLADLLNYRIIAKEVRQEVKVGRYVLVRIIDALGFTRDGEPVLIDYKTTSKIWKPYGGVVPEAMTFQSQVYLLPPAKSAPLPSWPVEMHYLVSSVGGEKGCYPYRARGDERDNVLHMVTLVKDAIRRGYFPKVQGYNCRWCDFFHACYEREGWEDLYKERKGKGDEETD